MNPQNSYKNGSGGDRVLGTTGKVSVADCRVDAVCMEDEILHS